MRPSSRAAPYIAIAMVAYDAISIGVRTETCLKSKKFCGDGGRFGGGGAGGGWE